MSLVFNVCLLLDLSTHVESVGHFFRLTIKFPTPPMSDQMACPQEDKMIKFPPSLAGKCSGYAQEGGAVVALI